MMNLNPELQNPQVRPFSFPCPHLFANAAAGFPSFRQASLRKHLQASTSFHKLPQGRDFSGPMAHPSTSAQIRVNPALLFKAACPAVQSSAAPFSQPHRTNPKPSEVKNKGGTA